MASPSLPTHYHYFNPCQLTKFVTFHLFICRKLSPLKKSNIYFFFFLYCPTRLDTRESPRTHWLNKGERQNDNSH